MLYVFQVDQGVEKYAGAVHRIAAELAGAAGKTGSHPKSFLRLCRKLAGRLQISPADKKLNRPAIMIRAGAGLALYRKKFPRHHRLPMRADPLPGLPTGEPVVIRGKSGSRGSELLLKLWEYTSSARMAGSAKVKQTTVRMRCRVREKCGMEAFLCLGFMANLNTVRQQTNRHVYVIEYQIRAISELRKRQIFGFRTSEMRFWGDAGHRREGGGGSGRVGRLAVQFQPAGIQFGFNFPGGEIHSHENRFRLRSGEGKPVGF